MSHDFEPKRVTDITGTEFPQPVVREWLDRKRQRVTCSYDDGRVFTRIINTVDRALEQSVEITPHFDEQGNLL